MKSSITNTSKSVPIKQLNASLTEQTIGSPLTLKEVFTKIGQLVIFLNSFINPASLNQSKGKIYGLSY